MEIAYSNKAESHDNVMGPSMARPNSSSAILRSSLGHHLWLHAAGPLEKPIISGPNKQKPKTKSKMISSKTLIKLAKKWQRLTTLKRKRISYLEAEEEKCCSDEKRFMVPLTYLKSNIFVKLLDMAMEMQGDGPIMLPWEASFVEYALSLIQRCVGEDLQEAFLVSMATSNCLLSSSQLLQEEHTRYQTSICSF
ncbi:hypothetical protein V2J09_005550 [Rumex salicifolius]